MRGLLPLLLAAGCGAGAPDATVAAAASLAAVLPRAYAACGEEPRFDFAASSTLAHRIARGLPADLFVSADARWVDWLRDRGIGRDRVVVFRARLALLVRQGVRAPEAAADLKDPAWRRIAVGAEGVPVGEYARRALEGLGVDDRLLPCRDARAVVNTLRLGEADAAVAYEPDAAAPGVEVALFFEEPSAEYHALVLRDRPAAHALLACLFDARARAILADAGFAVAAR